MHGSVFRAHSGGRGWRVMVDPPRKDRRLILRSLGPVLSAHETSWPYHVCRDSDLSEVGVGGRGSWAGESKAEEAQVIPLEDGVSVGSRDTWGCFQVCASTPGGGDGEGRKLPAALFFSHRQLARKSGTDDVITVSLENTLAGTSATSGLFDMGLHPCPAPPLLTCDLRSCSSFSSPVPALGKEVVGRVQGDGACGVPIVRSCCSP